jgi:hypothetical protein
MAIIAVVISVYVLLVAYLPNVSFSELRFLPGGRPPRARSINSDHRAIYGNNTNDNSRNNINQLALKEQIHFRTLYIR